MNNAEGIATPTIGIYLGSKTGNNPSFKDAIVSLGKGVVKLGYTVVYGGGGTGLMGVLAETVKSYGGTIIGITTEHLSKIEKPYKFLDELHIVSSMYERKRLIHEKSSRFIAMPGGIGTFDELFETWCAIKIGTIRKPLGLINIDGYFNPMIQFVTACTGHGFLKEQDIKIPTLYNEVSAFITYLEKELHGNSLEFHFDLNRNVVQKMKNHLIDTEEIS